MIKPGGLYEIIIENLHFWKFDEIKNEWDGPTIHCEGTRFLVLKTLGDTKIAKILIDGNVRYFYGSLCGVKCLNK